MTYPSERGGVIDWHREYLRDMEIRARQSREYRAQAAERRAAKRAAREVPDPIVVLRGAGVTGDPPWPRDAALAAVVVRATHDAVRAHLAERADLP